MAFATDWMRHFAPLWRFGRRRSTMASLAGHLRRASGSQDLPRRAIAFQAQVPRIFRHFCLRFVDRAAYSPQTDSQPVGMRGRSARAS